MHIPEVVDLLIIIEIGKQRGSHYNSPALFWVLRASSLIRI